MKIKTAVAMLLVTMFALSSLATITIKPARASPGSTLTLSDSELMLFAWEYDPGSSLTTKTDVAGPGVQFDLAGLGKAGVGNKNPWNLLAGGAYYYGLYSDFSGYDQYSMLFTNVGSGTVSVSLFMNTGFTDSGAWGTRDWSYNIFWGSNWVTLDPGKSAIVTLNFSSSYEAWGVDHDPEHHGYTNPGHGLPVWRLNEVTNIGFQVLGSGSASVLASGTLTKLYIDPPVVSKISTDVNSFFDVFVTLSNFTNLAGFDIQLTWDNNLINETSHEYTTSLNALWGAGKWNVVVDNSTAGFYELAAAALATSASNPAGASVLFKKTFQVVRSCNFPLSTSIHFALVKLSDNTTPIPNVIYAAVTDGTYTMSNTKPDLEFKVKEWIAKPTPGHWEYVSPPYVFHYCKTFEVEVYVTHIHDCSPLTDYDVRISFDPTLARFVDVDVWGIFGNGTCDYSSGVVHVHGDGSAWYGDEGLLFTLTFHVEFSCIPAHIWKNGNTNYMTFPISITDASLSFGLLGNIGMSGITVPSPLSIEVDFIRGDVDCNGVVNMADISAVAFWYNHPATDKLEYDLTNDGVIDI